MRYLRISVLALWCIALIFALLGRRLEYYVFSMCTALTAAALIHCSRDTQGHYRLISKSYMIGSMIWGIVELLRILTILYPSTEIYASAARNCSFLPNVFFSAGLLFFALYEYNRLHFYRITLHTFAIAFFAFMIVQKLLLYHYAGIDARGFRTIDVLMYFFLIVFTIVLVFSIFAQTEFKGHTGGTNLSAVMLVLFNLTELNRLYCIVTGIPYKGLISGAIGLLGIVVYSWAQSDPKLIEREIEPDEVAPGDQVKDIYIWGNSAVFLIAGIFLRAIGVFDNGDMYILGVMLMAYIVAFKSIQTNVYSTLLIEHQKAENERLEKLVEEKTAELRAANEALRSISETDELTGLRNRRYIMGLLHKHNTKDPYGVLLMDLDHFKQINDNFGHDAGDIVLKEVGRRLRSIENEHVIPIRMGGDEFMVIVRFVGDRDIREVSVGIAEMICSMMDEPIDIGPVSVTSTACIGICFCPEHSDNIDALYKIADDAMYEIKHKYDKSIYRIAEL